jgi:hypothetical protein
MRPRVVIVDIDGTVALMGKSDPGRRSPFDWDRVGEDNPNLPVIELVRVLRTAGFPVVFVSGRSDVCRMVTQHWLVTHGAAVGFGPGNDQLLMRAAGDFRGDEIVKLELYRKHVEPVADVAYVIDDRNKVVAMWRSLGLTVLQCANGDF